MKRALLVGIDDYANVTPLKGCVQDVQKMATVLARHHDGSPNFECQSLTNPGSPGKITRALLRQKWRDLFAGFSGDVLFYFSGHGTPTDTGGYLVTQDATEDDWGLAMNDLLILANESKAQSVLIVLDCCYSGGLGNPPNSKKDHAELREGVTVLSASLPSQTAAIVGGQSVFTELVVGALQGGAGDVRGRVSAASVYAYVEAALGAWDQRPMYKSHASKLEPIRYCEPLVPDALLRSLPQFFKTAASEFAMTPSYERTHNDANPDHVKIFDSFKTLQSAGLLKGVSGNPHLYYIAVGGEAVALTALGQFYWRLANDKKI
ncbi:MAG: caspase family protein [Rhizomicrobium sp.]